MMLHHAYLIKGWLLDKDPPKEIIEAVEAIIAAVNQEIAQDLRAITRIDDKPHKLRDEAGKIVDRLASSKTTSAATDADSPPSQVASEPDATATSSAGSDAPTAAKRDSGWSPERRAAAAERMKKARAAKAAKKLVTEPPPNDAAPAPAKPYKPASAEKLIQDHDGYAGRRDPGQPLTDEDWPDIKARLARKHSHAAIASDYDQDPEDLDHFIASCQRREARSSGEAGASPSGVASGAQRRT